MMKMHEDLTNIQATPFAVRDDHGKPPLGLIDYTAQVGLANVLAYGAEKYDIYNWRKGMHFSRLYNATLRHLGKFIDGEDIDPESGLYHIDHAQFGLMVLSNFNKLRPEWDDRYCKRVNISVPVPKSPTIGGGVSESYGQGYSTNDRTRLGLCP